MIKLLIALLVLPLININAVISQNNYVGKYYCATIMKGKGFPCNEVGYCVLKFSNDSVEVSYPVKAYCNTNELSKENTSYNEKLTKKYLWVIENEKIAIPKFEQYSEYKFEEKDENFIKNLYPDTSETNVFIDSLIYHKYIYGKPSLVVLDIERKVAKKWGMVMEYITGDCTTKLDYLAEECEVKNKQLYEYLNIKFGENWKAKFDEEVLDEVKQLSQKTSLNDSLMLKGIVKMENTNELLPHARIELKNNKINTFSDFDGNFILSIENYNLLKFSDTLQINFIGLKQYTVLINSIEELRTLFNISNINSFNITESVNNIEQHTTIFCLEEPGDGYIQIVTDKKAKKRWFKRKDK